MIINHISSINNNSNSLKQWCSNIITLSNNPQFELFDAKKIYFIFLKYKIWNESYIDLKNKCFLNKDTKFVYINNNKYNYNLVEYMCFQKLGFKFSVLDFCATLGIFIPHYCYHPDLSIAGNCRMCLIQLDGALKPIASCAITMSNNMILNTQSIFVKKIQEEFLNFYY